MQTEGGGGGGGEDRGEEKGGGVDEDARLAAALMAEEVQRLRFCVVCECYCVYDSVIEITKRILNLHSLRINRMMRVIAWL